MSESTQYVIVGDVAYQVVDGKRVFVARRLKGCWYHLSMGRHGMPEYDEVSHELRAMLRAVEGTVD